MKKTKIENPARYFLSLPPPKKQITTMAELADKQIKIPKKYKFIGTVKTKNVWQN